MRQRNVQDIINTAFETRLISEPPPFSTTFMIVDTDGSIVSIYVTHEFMEDALTTKDLLAKDVMEQLLLKRAAIREDRP